MINSISGAKGNGLFFNSGFSSSLNFLVAKVNSAVKKVCELLNKLYHWFTGRLEIEKEGNVDDLVQVELVDMGVSHRIKMEALLPEIQQAPARWAVKKMQKELKPILELIQEKQKEQSELEQRKIDLQPVFAEAAGFDHKNLRAICFDPDIVNQHKEELRQWKSLRTRLGRLELSHVQMVSIINKFDRPSNDFYSEIGKKSSLIDRIKGRDPELTYEESIVLGKQRLEQGGWASIQDLSMEALDKAILEKEALIARIYSLGVTGKSSSLNEPYPTVLFSEANLSFV